MSTRALLLERSAVSVPASGSGRASTSGGRSPDPAIAAIAAAPPAIAAIAAAPRYLPESLGPVGASGGIVPRRGLFERLDRASRVAVVSGSAGSGKTVLLQSWIGAAGLAERTAWIPVQPDEHDPQRFWISVISALRRTAPGARLVQGVTAAPELDGWTLVGRLLADLGSLTDRIWLVIDDLHELNSTETLRQLELLLADAPATLRLVLATRKDLRIGLHRVRLRGELTEIRAADLRFTVDESRELLELAGAKLPDGVLAALVERTEGWAAGLRLAALSLAGHPDPERFATEFCGSERTVADYLLAEVLERQSKPVRQLLLRTSVLERVNGELADLLTGDSGGERVLQDLEQAGAFVVSLDTQRSWFHYHRLFADLLRLELRRTAPAELPALHASAAGWFARHGFPVDAVRHAQAAQDWELAAQLLTVHWVGLYLDGQTATARELLAQFPAGVAVADAELTALMAASKLTQGSLEEAERYLARAARGFEGGEGLVPVPAERCGRLQVLLAIVRLALARQRGDLQAVAEEADRLIAAVEAPAAEALGLGEDLRALAMINLGIAEAWAARLEDADRHLEQGVTLARRIGRPYLELTGLAYGAEVACWRSYAVGAERSRQAIELAERHGWGEDPAAGVAYAVLGGVTVGQGRLAEARPWLERAEHTLRTEAEPATGMYLHHLRGLLELARGCDEKALADIQAAERLAGALVTRATDATAIRARMLQALVRLGQIERVEAALAGLDPCERGSAEMRTVLASLRLAQHDPQAATAALAPVIDGSVRVHPTWVVAALLLEAIARDALGDQDAAGCALERTLDLAAPDRLLISFLLHPAPELLERYSRHPTAHAALVADILDLLVSKGNEETGSRNASEGGLEGVAPPVARLREPLTQAEARVLRYLPTGLSVTEIAGQLFLSANTVRTHMRHIYDKLDTHRRHEAIERARDLALLAPCITVRKQ